MKYLSTRDINRKTVTAGEAICKGIADDGGLFLPDSIPSVSMEELAGWQNLSYQELAARVLALYLTDYSAEQIKACVDAAYTAEKFSDERIAPTRISRSCGLLELWHGPTCAFKDMALQLLPRLLVTARENLSVKEKNLILVATSGDTGKAALEGFADVPGTAIAVFYPKYGVSALQQLQMQTQKGKNVAVFGIRGNFDDAQTGVKKLFTDAGMQNALAEHQMRFSSANSINWGRLCPQIVYYFASYFDMVKAGKVKFGEPINFCVPTGNFGDILAGYYAKKMGLPVARLICASNRNRVLTDFFETGVYNRNREFYQTASPSMDILISSNLERLLYLEYGQNAAEIQNLFTQLRQEGRYQICEEVRRSVSDIFAADSCDDSECFEVIRRLYEEEQILIDPHTAVGVGVLKKYREKTGDRRETVVLSTASPYKFCKDVLAALEGKEPAEENPFVLLDTLEQKSGVAAPPQMKALADLPVRFDQVLDKEQQAEAVLNFVARQ